MATKKQSRLLLRGISWSGSLELTRCSAIEQPSPTKIRRNSSQRAAAPGCTATSGGPWMRRRRSPGTNSSPFRSLCNTRGTRRSRSGRGSSLSSLNRELIGSGVHPATGVRHDLDPAEWTRTDRILDVRNGDLHEVHDLIEERPGKQTVRWTSITLRAAKQPRQKKERWHGYYLGWKRGAYALTLRAENQCDWDEASAGQEATVASASQDRRGDDRAVVRRAR